MFPYLNYKNNYYEQAAFTWKNILHLLNKINGHYNISKKSQTKICLQQLWSLICKIVPNRKIFVLPSRANQNKKDRVF